jgi:hypothetical protein
MTRRFRLLPITTQSGFTQTIVLPPAVRPPRERETPTPGDCTGVADPPAAASVRGVITGEEICWTLLTAVPEGYTAEPSYCDQSESPGTWQLTRACDGEVFDVLVTSVEIVE